MTPAKLDHLVAVDRCGCIVGAIVDDPTFTGQVWLRKFYRENVGLEIRRVKAADFHGLDVCEHVPVKAQGELFGGGAA